MHPSLVSASRRPAASQSDLLPADQMASGLIEPKAEAASSFNSLCDFILTTAAIDQSTVTTGSNEPTFYSTGALIVHTFAIISLTKAR